MPAVRAVYDAWASRQLGPLTRRGASFHETDGEVLGESTGTTLATDPDGAIVGYARCERGRGYGSASWTRVLDLLAVDPRAYPAPWRFFGGFASVTGEIGFRTCGAVGTDEARLHLTTDVGRVVDSRPYMLRVDDVAALTVAVADARFVDASEEFAVVGDLLGEQDGSYRLEGGGCVRTGPAPDGGDLPTFAPRGLTLSYAGVQSAANLRQLGLLPGPTNHHDAVFDGWSGGAPVHIRDYC